MANTDHLLRNDRIRSLRNLFLTLSWISYKLFTQRLQDYGLTQPQFVTLFSLVRFGQPASMRDLTEVAAQDGPTMTGIVDRLVKMDLVYRTRDEQDRRVVLVNATPKGVALAQKIKACLEKDDIHGLNDIGDEALSHIEAFMDQLLVKHLEKLHGTENIDFQTAKQDIQSFADNPIGYLKRKQIIEEQDLEKQDIATKPTSSHIS